MPKPTRDEWSSDESLKLFDEVIAEIGARLDDEQHPLAAYAANHLAATTERVAFRNEKGKLSGFVRTYFRIYGYGVSQQAVNGWIRDSRKMSRLQLARWVDLMAHLVASSTESAAYGDAVESARTANPFEEHPGDSEIYRSAITLICRALFGITDEDRDRLLKASIIRDTMRAPQDCLFAVAAMFRAAQHDGASSEMLDAMQNSETLGGDAAQSAVRLSSDCESEVSELFAWLSRVAVPDKRTTEDDTPF